ncbi:hypothetical protein H1S01_13290 [Heliobacterium chlorum]|uniref:Uncharacterized protein n=1 Tax=Heliobacterium chlorum TaxID=2698 RepID=A0ABR7T7E4_HELCL|nr:hypothetical protein [Heliobacterium chlorum]MBC9785481.1 hypothetical protein [Heliobacterium chlorum]
MADDLIFPQDGSLNLDSFSLEDLEADLHRSIPPDMSQSNSSTASESSPILIDSSLTGTKKQSEFPSSESNQGTAAALPVQPVDGLAKVKALAKSRWMLIPLGLILALALSIPLVWGIGKVYDHYLVPPESYGPERLAEYANADKVIRDHLLNKFEQLSHAVTENNDELIDQALTEQSPRREEVKQSIASWHQFFSRYPQFEDPEYALQVYLVRNVKVDAEKQTVEAVADVSAFSSYHVSKQRLEKSHDYVLWVRLVYRDGDWRLDDFRRLREGSPETDSISGDNSSLAFFLSDFPAHFGSRL